jgi:hypothetical protein
MDGADTLLDEPTDDTESGTTTAVTEIYVRSLPPAPAARPSFPTASPYRLAPEMLEYPRVSDDMRAKFMRADTTMKVEKTFQVRKRRQAPSPRVMFGIAAIGCVLFGLAVGTAIVAARTNDEPAKTAAKPVAMKPVVTPIEQAAPSAPRPHVARVETPAPEATTVVGPSMLPQAVLMDTPIEQAVPEVRADPVVRKPAVQRASRRVAATEPAPRQRVEHVRRPVPLDYEDDDSEETEKPAPKATETKTTSGNTGTVTISSKPACKITIDGKPASARHEIALSAGSHKVHFVNAAEDIDQTVEIAVFAGEHRKLSKDFTE